MKKLFIITAVTAFALWLALPLLGRPSEIAQWGKNLSRLRSLGIMFQVDEEYTEGGISRNYDCYFGMEERYDESIKYYDKDTKSYYDWLIFPNGVRFGTRDMIYAMSPRTYMYGEKACRKILFRSSDSREYLVDIVSVEELKKGYRGESYKTELYPFRNDSGAIEAEK